MITTTNEKTYEFRGLSTDEKPVESVGNGSIFIEIDTGKVFLYDAENKVWREIQFMNLLDYILGKRYVESQISKIKPEEKMKMISITVIILTR